MNCFISSNKINFEFIKNFIKQKINISNFLSLNLKTQDILFTSPYIIQYNNINTIDNNINLIPSKINNKKTSVFNPSKINHKTLTKFSNKNFSLYIPQKKLIFQKHSTHGNVYPVFLADIDYHNRYNPSKFMPLFLFFTGFNMFILCSGFGILPPTKLFEILYLGDAAIFFSVLFNIYLGRNYFNSLINYKNRVKNMFLLPSGDCIIIETFDKNIHNIQIQDIFERRIYLRYDKEKNSEFTNNENSFRANFSWGFNKENYFEGKRKFLDYEIFNQILHRINIDTSQVKFEHSEISLNFWTPEEKRQIIKKFSGRKILQVFNFNFLRLNYFQMKKIFLQKYKKNKIQNKINNQIINFYDKE